MDTGYSVSLIVKTTLQTACVSPLEEVMPPVDVEMDVCTGTGATGEDERPETEFAGLICHSRPDVMVGLWNCYARTSLTRDGATPRYHMCMSIDGFTCRNKARAFRALWGQGTSSRVITQLDTLVTRGYQLYHAAHTLHLGRASLQLRVPEMEAVAAASHALARYSPLGILSAQTPSPDVEWPRGYHRLSRATRAPAETCTQDVIYERFSSRVLDTLWPTPPTTLLTGGLHVRDWMQD